ncbi:MAG: serine/threonine protein kinase, partial [Chloroflexi bacterium]|nr:serine/threonine protein kinase [Chloroflexota bacterium]
MPSERVRRRVETFLDEIDAAAARADWATVRDRSLAVLGVDPENEDAKAFLSMADKAQGGASVSERAEPPSVSTTSGSPGKDHPSSFSSGRYVVKEFLGEGGKKKVYLAHDTVLDRDVAFALIKTEGLDDNSRRRITREAQAMGRLGDHPNIVPIFDLGQENDPATGVQQPFMVLPLMAGGDVEGLIENAPDHRTPLERVLQIATDTCEGLVFAHSKGIVHRDLKPGNVWLTERGAARIGDFGLAVATDRSRLTREGMMVGTVAYMQPEQAMGGEITPQADLYSLGCMLYEMVTGRPPFLGDDDIAIIGQHINTPPVAPTWHRPDCPKPLDTLIMRLLAKDPKQRPESAGDVLRAMEAVDLKAVPSSRAGDGKGDGSNQDRSLESVSSGVFVGRQKEMDQLRAALEETLSGHGRMVT